MEMRIIMSQAKEINHELNIITLYPMNIIPGYILLAGIIFPAALRFAVNLETSPDKNTASQKKADVSDRECSFTLSQTAKKYNFSYKKYKAENYNFILIIYIISRFLAKIIFHFKIHHDFINLNI